MVSGKQIIWFTMCGPQNNMETLENNFINLNYSLEVHQRDGQRAAGVQITQPSNQLVIIVVITYC